MKVGFTKYFLLFFVLFLTNNQLFAQETPAPKDSTILYKNIESFSKRSKFTQLIFSLVFKPVASSAKQKSTRNRGYKKPIQKPYSTFEGKIIRNINIVTLDPFGYSVTDTTVLKHNHLYNAGNKIHLQTQPGTIMNLLLFRRNKPFNSLLVTESERLIRTRKYVHDVSFFIFLSGKGKLADSVDIFIRELDAWSIIPDGSISGSGIRIDLNDKNFLGTGNEFRNAFSRNISKGIYAFNANYFIPNIRNTYINSSLLYAIDGNRNFERRISVDRPFFSPLAKWAGGMTITSQYKSDSLKNLSVVFDSSNFRFKTQDYWVGIAHRIFKDNSEEDLVTNLIFAIRYLGVRYSEKPISFFDPLSIYTNENFYFGSTGISTRKYVQDKYIFKYGETEDVPIGKVYELTGGYQVKNSKGRLYLGMRFSSGNFYQWGYLSSELEYGTFFHASQTEQGALTMGINYFSRLFEVGKWKFRQFVKPQVTMGLNRFYTDSLTLNDGFGLDGFNSSVLSGSNRMIFTLQTQSYSPWNIFGFRFGPYFTYSLGMLSDAGVSFRKSKIYSQIGLGVLIKNANLVFSSFQFSISFYPLIPGNGQNIFKTNSFSTTDFGFRDFETGKPATVLYR